MILAMQVTRQDKEKITFELVESTLDISVAGFEPALGCVYTHTHPSAYLKPKHPPLASEHWEAEKYGSKKGSLI